MNCKILLSCIFAAFLLLCLSDQQVDYTVKGCSQTRFFTSGYEYSNGTITAYIMRNCCSDEIAVEKSGSIYKIIEKDEDGKICRCNCMSTVEIRNVENENFKVVFIDFAGGEKVLKNLKGGFCGWSTYATCSSDADCVAGGCSGQVCMGKGEDVVTTCEWRDCYDAKKYGMVCGCFNGRCQWAQS